jgi:hypothetical protein
MLFRPISGELSEEAEQVIVFARRVDEVREDRSGTVEPDNDCYVGR